MPLSTLRDVCCASMPAAALPVLAALRRASTVRVLPAADRVWVHWEAGDEPVLRRVLAAPGVELYAFRNGLWYRHGQSLPTFDVPDETDARPLYQALTPAPVQPADVPTGRPHPAEWHLARDARPRATTALLVGLRALTAWADAAPTAQLEAVSAAVCAARVLLRGRQLPALAGGERFWGNRLLLPLGYRAEPALPERPLREALGIGDNELGLCTDGVVEVVPLDVFEPVTRAGVRLALGEGVR